MGGGQLASKSTGSCVAQREPGAPGAAPPAGPLGPLRLVQRKPCLTGLVPLGVRTEWGENVADDGFGVFLFRPVRRQANKN